MYAALLNKELVLAVSEAGKVRENPAYLNQEVYRCPRCQRAWYTRQSPSSRRHAVVTR